MVLTVTFITRAITMIIPVASVIVATVIVIMSWETLGVYNNYLRSSNVPPFSEEVTICV